MICAVFQGNHTCLHRTICPEIIGCFINHLHLIHGHAKFRKIIRFTIYRLQAHRLFAVLTEAKNRAIFHGHQTRLHDTFCIKAVSRIINGVQLIGYHAGFGEAIGFAVYGL